MIDEDATLDKESDPEPGDDSWVEDAPVEGDTQGWGYDAPADASSANIEDTSWEGDGRLGEEIQDAGDTQGWGDDGPANDPIPRHGHCWRAECDRHQPKWKGEMRSTESAAQFDALLHDDTYHNSDQTARVRPHDCGDP
jgi:hypothetical protein